MFTTILLVAGLLAVALATAPALAQPNLRDALAKVTRTLPNGAANVTSAAIDTGQRTQWGMYESPDLMLSAPALATADLPDGATMTYDVLVSDNADLTDSPTVMMAGMIVQTGAAGAGAAASTKRFRLPSDAKRYVGIKATNSGAGDASVKSLTLEAIF